MTCVLCFICVIVALIIDNGFSGCTHNKDLDLTLETINSCAAVDDKQSCDSITGYIEGSMNQIPNVCKYRPSFIDIISGEYSNE